MLTTLYLNYAFILGKLHHFQILDKTGHFLGFLFLFWLIDSVLRIKLRVTFLGLVIYAAFTELGQYYLSYRTGQVSDFIADVIGCCCYFIIVGANRKLRQRRANNHDLKQHSQHLSHSLEPISTENSDPQR